MMESFYQDLRYGLRTLIKKPGFTFIAVMTLALGIGANTAIFSIVNAVLLRPLPYPEPDRVVSLWETDLADGASKMRVAPANFIDWRDQSKSFESLAAFAFSTANLTGLGDPEQITGAAVSEGYFKALGVAPRIGRAFLPEEHRSGEREVIILGYGLWQQKFAADPAIVGKTISINGAPTEVVGVMPPGIYPTRPTAYARLPFSPAQQQYFVPLSLDGPRASNRRSHVYGVIGRLKSDVTIEQARAEMDAIGARLEAEHPLNQDEGIMVSRFIDEVVGDVRPAMLILFAAVGFVLLIACANVAGLLLARFAERKKEIAIRSALGAGRIRLVRQFLVEGLVLALLGGALGVWVAWFGNDALTRIIPQEIPRFDEVKMDAGVFGFTLLLSFITSVMVSLVPSLQASKSDVQDALKEGGRSSGGARQKTRRVLVVAQVAIAVVLLTGAALMMKSFWRLSQVNPGFDADRALVISLSLPRSGYGDWRRVSAFYDQLLEKAKSVPGIRTAGITYDHPLESNWIDSFTIETGVSDPQGASADLRIVSPDFFTTIGTPLISGRFFTEQDDVEHPGAVIVNEAFAKTHFPGENPIGRRLGIPTPSRFVDQALPSSFEIVGIVKDVKSHGLSEAAQPSYYLPARQFPQSGMSLVARTDGDALSFVGAMRQQVWAIDPELPIADITTMEALLSDAVARPRFNMTLMAVFAGVALSLAALGLYGLLSYSVAQRTQEIGIRMALGAKPGEVLRMVAGQGLGLALAGVIIGVIAALALTRLIQSLLFEVSSTDPLIFVAVPVALAIVALGASLIPARRATRVDPMTALRYE